MIPVEKIKILEDILDERVRQDVKWGIEHHSPEGWLMILAEEFGEVSRAVCDYRMYGREASLPEIATELVQLAAVAVSMLERYHSGEWQPENLKEVR